MVLDIIDRCTPAPGSVDPTHGLSTSAICTQTDQFIMRDGFRSFPSGHSSCTFLHPHATRPVANGLMSVSFAGLGFLSLYLAGKLHLFDRRGHTASPLSACGDLKLTAKVQGKAWLSLSPLACAALVAISRTMDYRRMYSSHGKR
jgi:diacylglycerol diphosphate phosphatase/phosphatidate phosphatase